MKSVNSGSDVKKILAIALVVFCSVGFADSIRLTLENDCLFSRTMGRKNQDNDYTHGTGLEYGHDDWKFVIQQNMYTPSDICTTYHILGSRPYAGWLGAEVGKTLIFSSDSLWTHYTALNFGMVGPSARAGETQAKVHELLGCRKPLGWDTQLSDEFCVNAQWWSRYSWYVRTWFAIEPSVGVLAGTLQDAAEIGTDIKAGWNIAKRNEVRPGGMFSATTSQISDSFWNSIIAYIFVGGGCRYWLYNHFLEGSLFHDRDSNVTVDPEPFVGEIRFGAYLEIRGIYIKWYGILRTDEYKTQDDPADYGGLFAGYIWDF